jgi:hypothetical protein
LPSTRVASSFAASARACSRRSWPRCDSVGAALGQLDAAVVLLEEGAQLLLEGLEDRDVLVELGDQAVDGLLGLVQQLALLRAFALVAFHRLGQRVQQARAGCVLYWNMRRSMTAAFT